jgi:hypothetical protein
MLATIRLRLRNARGSQRGQPDGGDLQWTAGAALHFERD